eukprot:462407_1
MLQNSNLLASIIFISIFTTLCTVLSLILTYQLFGCKQNQKFNARRTSKMLIFLCILVSTVCQWGDLSRHIICYIQTKGLFYYPLNNIMCFADFFYYLGSVLFYIIAIYRLQVSFQSSQYSISPFIVSFVYTLIGCVFILAIYYSVIVFLTPNDVDNEYNEFWIKHDIIPMIIIGAIDFILNTSLLILFITKLKQILHTRLSRFNYNLYNLMDDKNTDIQSQDVIKLIIRHSLLFGLAIITNQIWYIAVVTRRKKGLSDFCFRALENAANCIVLFLGLKQNSKLYFCLCGCFHQLMQKCFLYQMKGKMDNADTGFTISSGNESITIQQTDLSVAEECV